MNRNGVGVLFSSVFRGCFMMNLRNGLSRFEKNDEDDGNDIRIVSMQMGA